MIYLFLQKEKSTHSLSATFFLPLSGIWCMPEPNRCPAHYNCCSCPATFVWHLCRRTDPQNVPWAQIGPARATIRWATQQQQALMAVMAVA